ncbi:mitochondrial ATP-dependent zinc metallopeptidase [Trypanosoma theileri]|uniref:Mitochondrial ATP-dependent zinc metallopeptidase n=1 Tax=Trypanosoma theileri TaxID=67003 RepID=A0A1X0P6W2_9TRYP|nr:mitochondrial ATP-dependent zinc metallopeptidase [Trypanosoma theileri]ORC92677.1 mitochondrial ATP-dependent zinc metallopeptidase [Trypanosoma theileri]
MSGRKDLQSTAAKKKAEPYTPQSVGDNEPIPSNSFLLQQLLLDLGFTDTAKTLVQETHRKLQLSVNSPHSQTNVVSDGMDPSDVVSTNNHNKNGNNFLKKSNGNNENVSNTAVMEKDELEGKEDIMLKRMTGMTLFRALAHQSDNNGNGLNDSTGILQHLCNMCISTMCCNTDYPCSSDGEECLTPLLRKLFNVLLENQDEAIDKGEKNNGIHSFINLPPAWVSLMQVFFAYVEVLWSQLYLVEVVSYADFLFKGWVRYRPYILERLSRFQEKIQRLLLEAHQLERFTNNCERSDIYCNKNNKTESATRNKGKNDSSTLPSIKSSVPFISGRNGISITTTEINKGIIGMFCQGAPTFRRNLEEVSTWILNQCGRCVQSNLADSSFEARNTEPISTVEDTSGISTGESKEIEESSSQKLWHQCMGAVRQAVLVTSENVKDQKENKWESLPLIDPKLHWTHVALRVQLLAWVLGSLAEFAEILRKELYPSDKNDNDEEEEENNNNDDEVEKNTKNQSNIGSNEVRQKVSLEGTVLGFWYHNCASQIAEKLKVTAMKISDSSAGTAAHHNTSEGDETLQRRLPRHHRVEAVKEQEEIGRSLVNILKSAVHEYFLGNSVSVEPFSFQLLNDGLLYDEAINSKSSKNGSNRNLPPIRKIKNENDDDFRMFLIAALATGKLSQMEQNSKPQQVAFHHLLKRAFTTPKALLDLQDESVPMDVQLKALERITAYAVRRGTQGKNGVVKGLPHRKCSERNRNGGTINEPTTVRTHENDSSVFGEATGMAPPSHTQCVSENTGIGIDLPIPLEETGEPIESFWFAHFQSLVHLMLRPAAELIQAEGSSTFPPVEEEEASSSEHNVEPPDNEMTNEIQVVTVTPCGSLLALLTTKGRLLVYTMRNKRNSTQCDINEHIQGSFCEELILDTKFTKNEKEPRWYEHLSSFLRFSPCGRFLLCSVQNNAASLGKEEEANSLANEYTGKVFIYSMHCTDTTKHESSREINNDEDRLYADFRIHTAPIVVASWMDPRFWGRKISKNIRPLDENSPDWKCEAYKHLSVLQCLSCGTENVILRWSPADGSIIQKIATVPLHDILVSPLMQAIYTTDQRGQLSMYDAWNEHNIGFSAGNSVVVSHRGLPASLSMMRSSAEAREEGSLPKSTAPLSDGDMQHDYFVGARIIRFDRRRVTQCGAKCEPMATEISKVMQEKGLPAGMETRDSSRLGRQILQQVLGEEEARFIPCTQAMLDPSSASDNEDNNENRGHDNHSYRNQSDTYRDVEPCINPIPFVRSQQMHSGRNESTSVSNDNISIDDDSVFTGQAIFYKTGSRLVFDEVSQMLCQTACLWPPVPDPQYAPPQQPWNLLSMSVSGQPIWNEDYEKSLICHHCRLRDRIEGKSISLSLCNYYTDAKKEKNVREYKKSMNNLNGSSFAGVGNSTKNYNSVCTCRQSGKRVVLSPTASNGRYLCIMASVGPSRVALHRNRPLEYHAGMYACVVFDVLYGSVVRVIPVCSTLPHSSLMEDIHSHPHSNIRRVPIFMLPCSVAVVRRPRRQQQKQRSGSTLGRRRKSSKSPQMYGSFVRHLDHEDEELEDNSDDDDNDDYDNNNNNNNNNNNTVDADMDGDDSMVVVAVGALHSRTYTFNALTGSRIKVMNLRKQKEPYNRRASAEARPPSKRARHPYLSLAKPGVFSNHHFLDEDSINTEDARNEEDSDMSSSSIERQSSESREQYESERHALLRQLADKHGMSTLLRATVDLLRVVPFPFSQFDKFRGNGNSTRRVCEKQLSCNRRRSMGSTHVGSTNSLSMQLSLISCPSFLGQLHLRSGVFNGSDVPSTVNRRNKDEATISTDIRLNNVPFALVSYRTLRHLLTTGVSVSGQETKGEATEGTTVTRPEGVNAPSAAAPSRERTYFRCGVVNSVALWCDNENGGVYVFSSDEYGGLFVSGGLISLGE